MFVPSENRLNNLVIVMFSGAGSDSFDWFPLVKHLTSFESCLIVDKPGFLGTSKNEKKFQEQIVKDVFNVLQKLNLEKVFLVGHSLGFLSALLFYFKYKKEIKIIGICDLDGIEIDISTAELMRKMSPPKWMRLLQILIIGNLGLFRKSMTMNIEEYSKEYDLFMGYYKQTVQQYRISRNHIKAIIEESNSLPIMIKQYLFLKEIKLSIPLLSIKAISENGLENSNEIKYFPHLKELVLEVEQNGQTWKLKLVEQSNGQKKEIIASHFLHGEHPKLITSYIVEFIINKIRI